MDAAVLKHHADSQGALPPVGVNKWDVLRELAAARIAFGLSDRDLTVLQALISFHPSTLLGGDDVALVVYPSNKAICERLNGMPCSTMRRHLGNLVQCGFVIRRDSPNGKRYARRYGAEKIAYGFDLSPLTRRFEEISTAADDMRAAAERHKRLRDAVSLMRRDLAGVAEFGRTLRPDLRLWDQFSDLAILTARALRRKLDMSELTRIEQTLRAALKQSRDLIDVAETENMSTSDAESEQHHQSSDKNIYEPEICIEETDGDESETIHVSQTVIEHRKDTPDRTGSDDPTLPNIPLGLVLASCHEFKAYADRPLRHWHDLVRVADSLSPMMGISSSAWRDAKRDMGPEQASVTVIAMLERFSEIRSPGGYLRALSAKAADGRFSCGPMVLSLARRDAA